jgi:hypothetical protein
MSARFVAPLLLLPLLAFPAIAADSPPGPPWPVVISPDAITLRWYPDEVGEAQARAVASAHCAASGRAAGFGALEQDGSAELGTYRCE